MQKKEELNTKADITDQEAKDWIKANCQQLISNNERNRYYDKLGLMNITVEPDKMDVERSFEKGGLCLNFLVSRSNEEVRKGYIDKLLANKMMTMEPSKKFQSIVIFDWDDTLLCTSYLSGFQFLELSEEAKTLVKNLDDYAFKLLQKARNYGDLYIITNAAKGWVEYSSKLYLPKTFHFLTHEKVGIMSARSSYEDEYPGDFYKWKVEAFKSVKKDFDVMLITNLICIGDSNIQMEAAQVLGKEFLQTLVKTIKFRENPKPDELIKQQQLVCEKLEQIANNPKNLTIRLQRKQGQHGTNTSGAPPTPVGS